MKFWVLVGYLYKMLGLTTAFEASSLLGGCEISTLIDFIQLAS